MERDVGMKRIPRRLIAAGRVPAAKSASISTNAAAWARAGLTPVPDRCQLVPDRQLGLPAETLDLALERPLPSGRILEFPDQEIDHGTHLGRELPSRRIDRENRGLLEFERRQYAHELTRDERTIDGHRRSHRDAESGARGVAQDFDVVGAETSRNADAHGPVGADQLPFARAREARVDDDLMLAELLGARRGAAPLEVARRCDENAMVRAEAARDQARVRERADADREV